MMVEGLLSMVMEWMNGAIRLANEGTSVLHLIYMLHCLGFLLCSHTTGLTMAETMDLLKKYGAVAPPIDRMRLDSENVLAFSIFSRNWQGIQNWMFQRDQTPNLTEFDNASLKATHRIFQRSVSVLNVVIRFLWNTRHLQPISAPQEPQIRSQRTLCRWNYGIIIVHYSWATISTPRRGSSEFCAETADFFHWRRGWKAPEQIRSDSRYRVWKGEF